ncbi:hypothetical protein D3C77_416080 [compost metagenome]
MDRKILKGFHLNDDQIHPFCSSEIMRGSFPVSHTARCPIRIAALQLRNISSRLIDISFRNHLVFLPAADSGGDLIIHKSDLLGPDKLIINTLPMLNVDNRRCDTNKE